MSTSIIHQPALRLITRKSQSFPDGNREAFNAIESRLDSMKGRKFYALVFEVGDTIEYFAGLIPESEEEERRFTSEGFGVSEVEAGTWARAKLENWESKIDQIGPTIGSMIAEFGYDPSKPQIEFYRSRAELHLLVPVPTSKDSISASGEQGGAGQVATPP